jgi:hypothetical protein
MAGRLSIGASGTMIGMELTAAEGRHRHPHKRLTGLGLGVWELPHFDFAVTDEYRA